MHIVFLTQYFPPESGAPQNRLGDFARRLVDRGHVVQVVTAMPNYPLGKIFDGWRGQLLTREHGEAGEVLRSWIYASQQRGLSRQLGGYLSFTLSAAVTAPFRLDRADVLIWESPPPFLAPVAYLLARRLRAKLVMNVSDLWPQALVELGAVRSPLLIKAAERWEGWAYRSADLVTYQTEGIGDGIALRHPESDRFLYPNGVDTALFSPRMPSGQLRQEVQIPDEATVVGFVGNFARIHAVDQIIEAARLLQAEPAGPFFLLAGDGSTKNEIEARSHQLGLTNVRFPGAFPTDRVPDLLSLVDIGVVPTADVPVMNGARSSKMFELMAMEIPFVLCGRGEGAHLARESGAATIVAPENPVELASAIRSLLAVGPVARREMGRHGRAYAIQHFDRDAIATRVEQRLRQLANL